SAVAAAPTLPGKQRFRTWDPRSQTYLGFDGLRHPCRD
ncbi:MAG: BA14K family protein, partial [Xanthobacteraceae bacterium]